MDGGRMSCWDRGAEDPKKKYGPKYYTVYRTKDDAIIAFGSGPECAAMMGITLASFYKIIWRARLGTLKRFEVYIDDDEPDV